MLTLGWYRQPNIRTCRNLTVKTNTDLPQVYPYMLADMNTNILTQKANIPFLQLRAMQTNALPKQLMDNINRSPLAENLYDQLSI